MGLDNAIVLDMPLFPMVSDKRLWPIRFRHATAHPAIATIAALRPETDQASSPNAYTDTYTDAYTYLCVFKYKNKADRAAS